MKAPSPSQKRVLDIIARHEREQRPWSIGGIAQELGVTRAAIHQMLILCQVRGYLQPGARTVVLECLVLRQPTAEA